MKQKGSDAMRFFHGTLGFFFACLLLLTGCARSGVSSAPPVDRIGAAVKRMTTAEKAGQLMMVGFHGDTANEDIAFLLREYGVGGVILFDRNISSAGQLQTLTGDLQKMAGDWPLLVAIDEEGGLVVRGEEVIPPPPAAAEIGQKGDPAAARAWAARTAEILRSLGVNLNFAPVADLGLAGGRSYSDEPATVAAFAEAAADGYTDGGILCTLKHFPGIGKGRADTHEERVIVEAGLDTLTAEDMYPFRRVLAGHRDGDVLVMVGHIEYPAIDEACPASISPKVMALLRQETGFDGVVVTDDLGMGAVAARMSAAEAAVEAVRAGVDLVLICHEYQDMNAAHQALCRAIEDGRIPADRVNEAVGRILRLKQKIIVPAREKRAA